MKECHLRAKKSLLLYVSWFTEPKKWIWPVATQICVSIFSSVKEITGSSNFVNKTDWIRSIFFCDHRFIFLHHRRMYEWRNKNSDAKFARLFWSWLSAVRCSFCLEFSPRVFCDVSMPKWGYWKENVVLFIELYSSDVAACNYSRYHLSKFHSNVGSA